MTDPKKSVEIPDIAKLDWSEKNESKEVMLEEDTIATIGRDKDNEIVLTDRKISKKHAVVSFHDGVFMIADLDSSNGTFVNGEKITERTPLKDGDRIGIGSYILDFIQSESLIEEMMTIQFEVTPSEKVKEVEESPDQPDEVQIEELMTQAFEEPVSKVIEEAERLQPETMEAQKKVNEMAEAMVALLDQLRNAQVTVEALGERWRDIRTRFEPLAERMESVAGELVEIEQRISEIELMELLDQLETNPRDVTLLLKLSQQAALINDLTKGFVKGTAALSEVGQALVSELTQLPG